MRCATALLSAIALLSACVSPMTRSDNPEAFKSVAGGSISPREVGAFADCVLDGFDKAHFIMTNARARQQRRSNGIRVETVAGNSTLMSADVLDDGRVDLKESVAAALINTSGERAAFQTCLARFSVNRTGSMQ